MGWQVLGFGSIDVDEKYAKEILNLMIGDKKKVIDKIEGNYSDDFDDVEGFDGHISFKMDGNKGIDYAPLDRIKRYCKEHNIDVEISVGEYIESDNGGYYYNSSERE